jgi:hypothetical protein
MHLPRIPYVVVDTNSVRKANVIDPLIETFKNTGQLIMLPWTATYEFYRKNTATFWASVEHLCKEPDAIAFARSTMDLFQKIEVPYRHMATDVIAHEGTKNLRALLRDFRDGKIDYDAADAAIDTAASHAVHLVTPWEALFRAVPKMASGDKGERHELRQRLIANDRAPFLAVVNAIFTPEKIADVLVGMPVRGKAVGHATARRLAEQPTFASLMMLAVGVRAYEWTLLNGVDSAKGLVNDGIDIENVLVALYGVDFITNDARAHVLYRDLQAIAAVRWP